MKKWRKTEAWIRRNADHQDDECLFWPYGRDRQGYARATAIGFPTRLAHRIMCEIAHGPGFDGAVTRHLCGNGHLGCVNPKHLSWGTAAENVADQEVHGTKLLGEDVPTSVLTPPDIRKIRLLKDAGFSQREIASEFNVCAATIQSIIEGRTWGHVK